MKKNDIITQVKSNCEKVNWKIDELRIIEDPYVGWQIVVISPDFEGKSQRERKCKILEGLEDIKIEWLELLTPEEKEWAGSLPEEVEISNLPLWPEALARGKNFDPQKEKVRFLSDIDEDVSLPIITTFYSLRGGVGRSTALGYTAHILASEGKKVICIDMDLEAPGITALFGKENEIEEGMGLIHLLMEIEQGGTPDITKHLIRISDVYDLYCLPAGKPDANYARLLRFIDPETWYVEDKNPLRELVDQLGKRLPFTPDVILFDARTGITQLSGPLLFDLSDIAVIVFFPHPQAKVGTEALVKALLASKNRRNINGETFTPEIRFLVSPIPLSKSREIERHYKNRSLEWISEWLSPLKNSASAGNEILEPEITHFVSYLEAVASSDEIIQDDEIGRNYKPLAEWIDGFIEEPIEKSVNLNLGDKKSEILDRFRFSTGTAEKQVDFHDTFIETDQVKKALSLEFPLVLGRKGTGKTAIFRRLLEDEKVKKNIVTVPIDLKDQHPLFLNPNGFKEIEEVLEKSNIGWSEFWLIYISLVSYYSQFKKKRAAPEPTFENGSYNLSIVQANSIKSKSLNVLEITKLIEDFVKFSKHRLYADDWLERLDEDANPDTMLLFDGLDTGFGTEDKDRERRKNAIEGLFAFVTGAGFQLKNLKFKIMLREDIWKSLKFENKSHLFGRSTALKWSQPEAFLKIIIKQAIRNELFKLLLRETNSQFNRDIEDWGTKEISDAWNILVGERMKGGKTAFTRNWIWRRLEDGNKDHSPRYLIQLLHQAVLWEKVEQKRTPYNRSIIRPRALELVLPKVSDQALEAIRDEEFQELSPFMDNLTKIGRIPFKANGINVSLDIVNLAREIGLLVVYEEKDEEVKWYTVPELFRHALKMTRKGQV